MLDKNLSNILPMSNYFGKVPDPQKDRFDRRVTKQLSDIDFETDSEDDFEDIRSIKRQPRTVLTEENLRKYLNHETIKVNLEHHYWLKDSFVGKIGRMAPNLLQLTLRRLQVSDESFYEIANNVDKIQRLDVAECPFIGKKSMLKFFETCGESLEDLQVSNCQDAIEDDIFVELVNCAKLSFLDISYNKRVTDEGLKAFDGKKFPITHLFMNGMGPQVTGQGLCFPIQACKDHLLVYQGALMDGEGLANPIFGKALAVCFKLQSLDLGGCKEIGDDFFSMNLLTGEKMEEGLPTRPGFPELVTVKLNFLVKLTDNSATQLCRISPKLEHLELTGCEQISEFGIESIFKNFKNLKFVDINHIPIVNPDKKPFPPFYEHLNGLRPDIMVKRYQFNEVDPKDNMLRIPWRIAEKKKGKKKKGKKKK